MELHDLKPVDGARHSRKRVGRGTGSGHGKTSGRGSKGQNSRSGGGVRPGFEGGQTPLFKRLPKRGFTNMNRKEYAVVNIADLNCDCFKEGSKVTPEMLVKVGLVSKNVKNIKVLGNGKLEKNLIICAHKFSKSAEKGIVEAGGKIEVI
ncbi:MAG: 50S ribosomal protein L15 [Bacilli bacterium]|jgi:large subunit ribosomal protein L15|nr:50S ribosomal protein L15 [Bacilli bacterium]MDD3348027.1 50S ribosomal protein L15 [Bacilli bacterium]MDD4056369.1 50S ribosomal protein L15 [Bacilli bacterium]MDY0208939.1 50S ribosomal protein L15 [Bacilli bacterium]